MALIPIISQTWDTTSVFNPTRMNNIETNIATVSKATGIEYTSGVSVKDKLDSLSQGWTNAVTLATETGFTVYGRYNPSLKMAMIRLSGTSSAPASATYQFNINNANYRPIDEYYAATRFGGAMFVSNSGSNIVCTIRDLNTSQAWQSGFLMYPTQ